MPPPPHIDVQLVRDLARTSKDDFLQVREVELQNHYHGEISAPYRYFMVERSRLDAVAIVLFRVSSGQVELVLRSQLRPPLCFRPEYDVPLVALGTGAVQWEIPAGLVEPGEQGHAGLFARASAEAREEVGVLLPPERFRPLGHASSLSPGLIAEKLHFVYAEILDTDVWEPAEGDGHAVEEHSTSLFVPLSVALAAIEQGVIHDVKTEVGISRLQLLAAARGSTRPPAPPNAASPTSKPR